MIGACACFVMGVSFGGVTYAWNSGQIIGLFCTSGVLFIIFGFQKVFTAFTNIVRRVCPVEFFGRGKSRQMCENFMIFRLRLISA
jgi:hypothetical protein